MGTVLSFRAWSFWGGSGCFLGHGGDFGGFGHPPARAALPASHAALRGVRACRLRFQQVKIGGVASPPAAGPAPRPAPRAAGGTTGCFLRICKGSRESHQQQEEEDSSPALAPKSPAPLLLLPTTPETAGSAPGLIRSRERNKQQTLALPNRSSGPSPRRGWHQPPQCTAGSLSISEDPNRNGGSRSWHPTHLPDWFWHL